MLGCATNRDRLLLATLQYDGVHDTITSLAGAEMLQRYQGAMSGSGSHKDSSSSISQVGCGIKKN